jgi:uncharacterized GH25 family protein
MRFSKHPPAAIWWLMMLLAQWPGRADAQKGLPPPAAGTLTVIVIDAASDQGIAGAKLQQVTSGGRPHLMGNWTTDTVGRLAAQFSTSTGRELKFWAIADGYVPAETAVQRDSEGALPQACTVRLERAVSAGGIVLNEAGEPVAGVEVFVEFGKGPQSQDPSAVPEPRVNFHYEKTDAKGRWTCLHIPKRLSEPRFRLIHPDYATVVFSAGAGGPHEENVASVTESDLLASRAVLIMKRGLTINGTVVDSRLTPVEGAEVTGGDYPVWTPADGRFTFRNRPAGRLLLTARANGFAPQQREFWVSNGMEEARFRLERGGILKVRVEDSRGRPMAGALISVEAPADQAADQRQWETDEQGRFALDSTPAEAALYRISRFGYDVLQSQPLKADGVEHVVTFHARLRISGRVTDFDTRAPLAAFSLVPGVLHEDHHDWNQGLITNGRNGTYAVVLPKQDLPHVLRIEADDYYPEISSTFRDLEEEVVADFALKKGQRISGAVRLPNGAPATGAQVSLCAEDQFTGLAEAKFAGVGHGDVRGTDAEGGFSFQPQRGVKRIAAVGEEGYAEVSLKGFLEQSKIIRLQPWGRIAGTLRIGSVLGTNELIRLARIGSYSPQLQANGYTVLTDSQGRFTVERVPAGRHMIGRFVGSHFSHGHAVNVASGETTRLALGEGGRTVAGRVAAEDGRELAWAGGDHPAFLHTKLPPLTIPKLPDGPATNAWLRAYWDSQEGRERQISEVQYILRFESNNVFRAENVPAGEYECEIHYHEPAILPGERDACLGILRKLVVIPDGRPGESGAACDLGTMTIALKPSGH